MFDCKHFTHRNNMDQFEVNETECLLLSIGNRFYTYVMERFLFEIEYV